MMLQRHAVQKLHGQKGLAVLLANVVNCADIRVIQRRCGLSFTLKTGECLRVTADLRWQELQGDEAAKAHVLSFVNHSHAAAAEFLDNTVMRDDLVDHERNRVFLASQNRIKLLSRSRERESKSNAWELIGSPRPGILPRHRDVLIIAAIPDIGAIAVGEFQSLVLG